MHVTCPRCYRPRPCVVTTDMHGRTVGLTPACGCADKNVAACVDCDVVFTRHRKAGRKVRCDECQRERAKARERVRGRRRVRKPVPRTDETREKHRLRMRQWRAANKDKMRRTAIEKAEQRRAADRRYRERHPDRVKASRKVRYERSKDEAREYSRRYYHEVIKRRAA